MAGYRPLRIAGNTTGLVQDREEFILPNDAYPVLQNAFVWRERIKRKKGSSFLGRLQRNLTIAGFTSLNLLTGLESTATLSPGSLSITDGSANLWTEPVPPDGTLLKNGSASIGTVNYQTGLLFGPSLNLSGTFSYFPGLPVMGILSEVLTSTNLQRTIFFDTIYAYIYNNITNVFNEWIPGTTWTGTDFNFFWPMNYWQTPATGTNARLFWVTNFSGPTGDPIRYTDGTFWINFAPTIDAGGNKLNQCLAMIPFRGRMVVFNTWEGTTLAGSAQFAQRIRWAAIGNPISDTSTLFPIAIPSNVNANAWRDDIRGQGGFLDIPTSESIVSVGFVRDNLVIYCEHSTWQLRYTGRSIAPFQIEKVNSELGTESTFSAVQFDTSLVGFGDKGIVQCDSFKSERIDVKIPDIVFSFQTSSNGNLRIYGIREFQQRLAYWAYPYADGGDFPPIYPNRRLVYNYENDSWAIFEDSFTVFGNFQYQTAYTWSNQTFTWEQANFPWIGKPALFPYIAAGNQQGFVMILDQITTNEKSLYISNIIGQTPSTTIIRSPNHNLASTQVIEINGILSTDPYVSLNGKIFGIQFIDANNFYIYAFNLADGDFTSAVALPPGVYLGNATINVRDGFIVQSKKFNAIDQGQAIQLGFIDILLDNTDSGAITVNIFADYNDSNPVNAFPQNVNPTTNLPDTFFNTIIPTSAQTPLESEKNWQRVYCSARSGFLTIQYTLSNAQLNGVEQESDVQIDAQILWLRSAGRQLVGGF